MIYILYGDEIFLIKEEVQKIIKEVNIDNIISIDFSISNMTEILNEVCYVDLFNTKKLIIVNNFSFKKLKENEEKDFVKYLDNINDNVIIFKLIDSSLDSRKSIIKKVFESCTIFEAKKLDRRGLIDYLKNLFKKENYKITDEVIKKIINNCNYSNYSANNDFIFNEVNKLMLYKLDDKVITMDDVNNVISRNTEMELFNLVNAVMSRNVQDVFKEFKIIKEIDISPYVIISNLSKQFRLILQIKLLSKNMANDMIARKLNMNPYAVEINSNNAKNYKIDEIIDIMDKIFYTDEILKFENVDKFKVLEKFLLEIC